MTADEFRALLATRSDADLLAPCLHDEDAPYLFETHPAAWHGFRAIIVETLGVSAGDIRIVGSARFGFSLKPGQNFRDFRDTSDVDVVIVNADLFDELWVSLLAAAYPRPPASHRLGGWLQKRRNEVYTGWITPHEIRLDRSIFGQRATPVLDFRSRWFNALRLAARQPARRFEDIHGRLYRTWRHAELYHLHIRRAGPLIERSHSSKVQ
jgi:hypothetical protein